MSVSKTNNVLLCGFLLGCLIASAPSYSAERLYRWTDENGVIHYSDKVPPDFSKKERHIIDDSGRTREVLDAQKSAEKLAEEARLKEEEERAREIARKKAFEDRLLLDTYTNLDELIEARDNRIATMKSTINLKQESVEAKRNELTKHRKTAANAERRGIPVNEALLEQMEAVKIEIQSHLDGITRLEAEIETTQTSFNRDIARYKRLRPQFQTNN